MPKKKYKKSALENLLVHILNIFVFVGYGILFPFEFLIDYLATFVKRIKNFDLKSKVSSFGASFARIPQLKFSTFDFKIIRLRILKSISKIVDFFRQAISMFKVAIIDPFYDFVENLDLKKRFKFRIGNNIQSKSIRNKSKVLKKQVFKDIQKASFSRLLFNYIVLFVLGVIFSVLFIFAPIQLYGWYRELPQPILLKEISATNRPTRILDQKGQLLYEIYVDKRYDPVALENIPDHVIKATLAIEDHDFYKHIGFRPVSMLRAAKATVFEDDLQGASTITQQLVKNVLLTSERTISRKIKELVLSLLVERAYTKNEILEMYLNNIPYGGTSWGIQSGAKRFFGKDVSQLDLAESSFLAGLPSSPSTYSPFGGDVSLEKAKNRQKLVLQRMVYLKYINEEEAHIASDEELQFNPQTEYMRAPHFVNYVRDELEKKYSRRMVDFGGLTVTTTLDLDLQDKVQDIVTSEVGNSANLNISNGAAVALNVETGGILAYVGSIDYFKSGWGSYDIVTAQRQAGSTVKPITYALALSKGYTPASIIHDSPITYQLGGGFAYTPVNYDGKFHGNVTLRQALANSYNIPAVKTVKEIGPDNMVTLGNKMGLKNWKVDGSYGLAVTLGGKETRLLDLTNVFATFARRGMYKEVTPFKSILDANGFELYDKKNNVEKVLGEDVAYLISNILSDNNARLPAFGSRSALVVPGYTVAVKTGTTDEKRDNYTVGYTPSYVVGVWVGNNDNTPMNRNLASGLSGAAPIWNKVLSTILNGKPNEPFDVPANISVKTDKNCEGVYEVFIKGTEVTKLCPDKESDKNEDSDNN